MSPALCRSATLARRGTTVQPRCNDKWQAAQPRSPGIAAQINGTLKECHTTVAFIDRVRFEGGSDCSVRSVAVSSTCRRVGGCVARPPNSWGSDLGLRVARPRLWFSSLPASGGSVGEHICVASHAIWLQPSAAGQLCSTSLGNVVFLRAN